MDEEEDSSLTPVYSPSAESPPIENEYSDPQAVAESSALCSKSLKILEEFRQIYEERIRNIDKEPSPDGTELKLKTLMSWINDLGEQNVMLVQTVEQLEQEAADRVALLEDRLQRSSHLALEYMTKLQTYDTQISEAAGERSHLESLQSKNSTQLMQAQQTEEILKTRIGNLQNDISGLLELIRRARYDGSWDIDGLNFLEVTYEDIFGSNPYQFSSTCGSLDHLQSELHRMHEKLSATVEDFHMKDQEVKVLQEEVTRQRSNINLKDEQIKGFIETIQELQAFSSNESVKASTEKPVTCKTAVLVDMKVQPRKQDVDEVSWKQTLAHSGAEEARKHVENSIVNQQTKMLALSKKFESRDAVLETVLQDKKRLTEEIASLSSDVRKKADRITTLSQDLAKVEKLAALEESKILCKCMEECKSHFAPLVSVPCSSLHAKSKQEQAGRAEISPTSLNEMEQNITDLETVCLRLERSWEQVYKTAKMCTVLEAIGNSTLCVKENHSLCRTLQEMFSAAYEFVAEESQTIEKMQKILKAVQCEARELHAKSNKCAGNLNDEISYFQDAVDSMLIELDRGYALQEDTLVSLRKKYEITLAKLNRDSRSTRKVTMQEPWCTETSGVEEHEKKSTEVFGDAEKYVQIVREDQKKIRNLCNEMKASVMQMQQQNTVLSGGDVCDKSNEKSEKVLLNKIQEPQRKATSEVNETNLPNHGGAYKKRGVSFASPSKDEYEKRIQDLQTALKEAQNEAQQRTDAHVIRNNECSNSNELQFARNVEEYRVNTVIAQAAMEEMKEELDILVGNLRSREEKMSELEVMIQTLQTSLLLSQQDINIFVKHVLNEEQINVTSEASISNLQTKLQGISHLLATLKTEFSDCDKVAEGDPITINEVPSCSKMSSKNVLQEISVLIEDLGGHEEEVAQLHQGVKNIGTKLCGLLLKINDVQEKMDEYAQGKEAFNSSQTLCEEKIEKLQLELESVQEDLENCIKIFQPAEVSNSDIE